jgi:hypothetical protein
MGGGGTGMMQYVRVMSWGLVLGACVALASSGGCSAGGGASGSGSSGSGGNAGTAGNMNLGGNFGAGGGSNTGMGCSSDLQHVVDEDGMVVESCPPEEGCFEGACIPACEAAANAQGAIGCEYWTPTPPFYFNHISPTGYDGSCYAVFVANTWGREAALTATYQGNTIDLADHAYIPSGVGASATYAPLPATGLPPGEVAVIFLAHKPGAVHELGYPLVCPQEPAFLVDTAVHNSGRGDAFEILSDTPVVAYDIMPFGGAQSFLPSASLLYPRTAWGDNYIAVSPRPPEGNGQLWVQIVGTQDGTLVDVVPKQNLPSGTGLAAAPANVVTQFELDAGEIIQWMAGDPSGAVFQATAPIGMFTGNTYLRVSSATSSGGGQDSAHQQLPPVSALGSRYVAGSVVTRLATLEPESVPYRLLGVVDGTQLTYDPPQPTAPATINAGDVVEFETTDVFVVASQDEDHPFNVSQYMPGTGFGSRPGCGDFGSCGLGDEEWVVLLPPEQYLTRYVFFTDPSYSTTNLVVTRVRGTEGFSDVDIACLGTVTGWMPVGGSGDYEVAHVDLFRGGVGVQPGCATSRHEATSDGAFGVMVWGTDSYASYGYPAGGNVGVINEVVVIPEPPN